MVEAHGEMKSYMQTCGLSPDTGRASGATSGTLFTPHGNLDAESIQVAAAAVASPIKCQVQWK